MAAVDREKNPVREGINLVGRKSKALALALALTASSLLMSGCGQEEQQQAKAPPAAQVKVMRAIQRDTPLTSEFAGQVMAADEVKVQSKVSGNVVEKYVNGGQFVEFGQQLYKIDSRQYESAVLRAQANLEQAKAVLVQSQVTLKNSQIDLERYIKMLDDQAIPEQTVTTQAAQVRANEAAVVANEHAIAASEALLQTAYQDLADTDIYAPMSGKLSVDDVAVGTFVTQGQTTLVTIGSSDPIYVQFSISEAEYLKFMTIQAMQADHNPIGVTITLTDGREYPYQGQIVESDREMANNTGSLTMKAIFPNPSGLLLPGMFARVKLTGETVPHAILVPQRSVQQLLDKSFVMVADQNGKSAAKTVTLGAKVGSYYIINSGITANDNVIVEGLTNLREGVDLAITNVTAGEMGFTLSEVQTTYDADRSMGSIPAAPSNVPNRNPNAPSDAQPSSDQSNTQSNAQSNG